VALCAAVLVLRGLGFEGISHDDAARSLLAVDFAAAPRVDATGSSWLPAHTWLLGTSLRALRPTQLWALSLAAGVASCVAVVLCARSAGARGWALVGAAALPTLWPWSVAAAAAPGVPELVCVALVLWALGALGRQSVGGDLCAGLLLALACGHRYEAWWATAGVLLWLTQARAWGRVARVGAVALAAPWLWVLLDHHRSGTWLDFARRVRSFRASEGPLPAWWLRALAPPWLLLWEAPWAAVGGLWAAGTQRRSEPGTWAAAAVLAGLLLGELHGAGPTHHPERTLLLPVWLLTPTVAQALGRLRGAWGAAALALALAWGAYPLSLARVSSVDPAAPRAGRAVAAALRGRPGACWFVESAWLEFLWVEHSSEASRRAVPDRVYGGPTPTVPEALSRLPACASVAAVTSERLREALQGREFQERWRGGGWTVLVR
jgi:hypothetical protein